MPAPAERAPGPGVDASGQPVIDPTRNVLDLVAASIQRQDDLREAEAASLRREVALRAYYDEKLRQAETARIDAIRAVDVGAVNRAAEVAATQAGALAAQLIATAEASRVQVAAAASASVTSLAAALEPIQKDIRDLRDAQSRGQGGKEQTVETSTGNRAWVGIAVAAIVGVSMIMLGIIGVVITLLVKS